MEYLEFGVLEIENIKVKRKIIILSTLSTLGTQGTEKEGHES